MPGSGGNEVGKVSYKVEMDTSSLGSDVTRAGGEITSKLDELSSKMNRSFGYQLLKDIGSAFISMGQQAVQAFSQITQAALQSTAALEQNIGGVETLFKSASDTVIANAKQAYQTAGLSTNDYLSTVTGFAASLVQSTTRTVKSLSAEEVAARSEALDRQYDLTKRAYDKEYDAVKKGLDKQYDAIKDSLDKQYDTRKKELDKQYDAYSKALDKEIDAAEDYYDDRIEAAEKAYEADVAAYEAATEARLKLIDQEYKESLKLIDREEYERLQAIDNEIAALNAITEAERKADEEAERAQKRTELQKAINAAKSEEEREKAAKALSDYNAKIAKKDAEEARKQQISDLKDQKSAIKEETAAKKEAAKEQRDDAVEGVKEESKATLSAMKDQHKAEIEAIRDAKQAQLEVMRESREANLDALKEAQEAELEQLKAAQEAQLDQIKEAQQAQLEAYKEAQEERLYSLKKSLEAEKKALSSANEEVAANVEATAEDYAKAAELADMAIRDMSDNANKMGTPIASLQNAYQGFAKGNFTMLDNLKLGYGGTRSEMERLIKDANLVKEANGELGDLSIDSFADIVEAIHTVQQEMGITGTTAAEASGTIEGSMNSAKAAYDNFLNGTISGEEFGEAILTAAVNVGNGIVEIFNNLAEETPDLLGTLIGTERVDAIIEALSPLSEALSGLIGDESTAEAATGALSTAFDTMVGVISVISTILGTAITTVSEFVGWLDSGSTGAEAFKTAIVAIGVALATYSAIMGGVNAITNTVGLATKVLNAIMAANPIALIVMAIAGLIAAFIYLWNTSEEFRQFWISLWDKIMEVFNGAKDKLTTFFGETLPEKVNGVIKFFKELPSKAKQWALNLIKEFVAGITNDDGTLKGAGGKIVNYIISGISSFTKNLYAWGRDLIANFVNGIYSGFQWLNDAAIWVADTVRAFLGFSEPEKGPLSNFHTFPEDMMKLFADGIDENIDVVEDSVYNVSKRISGGFSVGYDMPDIAGYASDLGASITAANSTRIEVPVVLDGREIARATAVYNNEQLAWEMR